jgi:hypothetical protein
VRKFSTVLAKLKSSFILLIDLTFKVSVIFLKISISFWIKLYFTRISDSGEVGPENGGTR